MKVGRELRGLFGPDHGFQAEDELHRSRACEIGRYAQGFPYGSLGLFVAGWFWAMRRL